MQSFAVYIYKYKHQDVKTFSNKLHIRLIRQFQMWETEFVVVVVVKFTKLTSVYLIYKLNFTLFTKWNTNWYRVQTTYFA